MIRKLHPEYRGKLPTELGSGFIPTADMCACAEDLELCEFELAINADEIALGSLHSVTIDGVEYLSGDDTLWGENPEVIAEQLRAAYMAAGYYEDGTGHNSILYSFYDAPSEILFLGWRGVIAPDAITFKDNGVVVTAAPAVFSVRCVETQVCDNVVTWVADDVNFAYLIINGAALELEQLQTNGTGISQLYQRLGLQEVAIEDFNAYLKIGSVSFDPATLIYSATIISPAGTTISTKTGASGTETPATVCRCRTGYVVPN